MLSKLRRRSDTAEARRLEASLSGAASPAKADAQPETLEEEEEAQWAGGARTRWRC